MGARTWAEIDLGALVRNLAWIRARAGERRVIAVVKADAYGHGAAEIARTLAEAHVDALAVATLSEARELREAALSLPLLLLGGIWEPGAAEEVGELGVSPLVSHPRELDWLARMAERQGRRQPVHLKLDTGMTRLGLDAVGFDSALGRLACEPRLELEGFCSHLAEADDAETTTTARQRERFAAALSHVRDRGLRPSFVHLDNSAGIVHGPTPGTDTVRPGIALYGGDPTLERSSSLEPVMSLLTRVVHVRRVPAGTRVGYGGRYVTDRDTCILTLPLGYADGLPRRVGDRFAVGVPGPKPRRLPVVGRVSMDFATVDAGPDCDLEPGQEVLVFGRKGGLEITADEFADALDTIAYEVLVGIGVRVPRLLRGKEQWVSRGSATGRVPGSPSVDG